MKPQSGEVWENMHTKTRAKIIDRIFFNIHYYEYLNDITLDCYTHYKTFQKHWIKIGNVNEHE